MAEAVAGHQGERQDFTIKLNSYSFWFISIVIISLIARHYDLGERPRRTLELPCLQVQLQRVVRHNISENVSAASEVVYGDRLDRERKKSLSSCQLARDLNLTQRSAWYMQQRIRAEMATRQGKVLLRGIVEADETYVGGKPRKRNKRSGGGNATRGRGTRKTPVIGAVERGGKVVARVADDLSGGGVLAFIKQAIDPSESVLVTDEFSAYNTVRQIMSHAVIHHARHYADGDIHTNTIEGVWSLLKRAW